MASSANAGHDGTKSERPNFAYFPLGYKEGFSQWWSSLSPAVTEHRVLSFIPYLQQPPTHTETGSVPFSDNPTSTQITDDVNQKAKPVTSNTSTDPYGPRRWLSTLVKLPGKDRALNEFSVERMGEDVDNNLVILHGYGAGLAFFYKNFEGLSRRPGWKLYALDLLGMGRSSRPPFKLHAKDRQGKINEAENWFIDALEDWRKERKLDKFTLIGHSLGGYMAVCYALKYPGHLNKLILASPVGVPEDPYAVSQELPEPKETTAQNEFSQDQASAQGKKEGETPKRRMPGWASYLWDQNFSPFQIIRWAGPIGPRLVSGWTSRRFGQMPQEEAQALHDYSYSLFRQRGSGEYALGVVLAPGAFARSPLIRRIQSLSRQHLERQGQPTSEAKEGSPSMSHDATTARPRENGYPVVWMYGEHDWMDIQGGYDAVKVMNQEKAKLLASKSAEERQRDNGDAKVTVIRGAGHHVYLDGWQQFNEDMIEEMADVERRARRLEVLGVKQS